MPVSDRQAMIAGMAPVLMEGRFVFVNAGVPTPLASAAIAVFQEAEGLSLVLPVELAAENGFDTGAPMAQITLSVHSDLEGVGLTAAVATALADKGIPANVVAAYHHDHVFVPASKADQAMAVLLELQGRHAAG